MLSRDTLIDKADLLKRIDRVRRWSRNGDITVICDSLEHVLKCGHSGPNASLGEPKTRSRHRQAPSPSNDKVSTGAPCQECVGLRQRRASDAARQRKRRAKAETAA
jgi:hypothetical protein